MLNYAIRRLLLAIPTLIGISLVTFIIINLAPGDPAAAKVQNAEYQDPKMSARIYEKLKERYQLDKPIHVRYVNWLGQLVTGDFGRSFKDERPVVDKIWERVPATASVSALALTFGLVLAIPIGILAAAKRDSLYDQGSGYVLYALFSVPSYVMAILLIRILGVKWDLLPIMNMTGDNYADLGFAGKAWDLFTHFILITFCYTYRGLAVNSRFVRQNLLEVLQQDYVRTAMSKGCTQKRVVLRHAFPNTMIPLVTRFGMMLPALISGSVILEVIFNWPGIGRLFYEGILERDYPLVMALSFISAAFVLIGTLISDLLYAVVDPRISYS